MKKGIQNAYGIAIGIILLSALAAGAGAIRYHFGTDERVRESRMGSQHIPARSPGSPTDRMMMNLGIAGVAVGVLTLFGSGIAHMIDSNNHKEGTGE